MAMITWPDQLVRDIARRRSVIVVGAGVSMQATNAAGIKPKTWLGLLNAGVAKMPANARQRGEVRRLLRDGDFLTACELLRDALGRQRFTAFLEDELLHPGFSPAPIHASLQRLQSQIYLTPNFDKILEAQFSSAPAPFVVKCFDDRDVALICRGYVPIILKIHGTIDRASEVIMSRSDYANARNEFWRFYEVLSSLFITHTCLFVGCGFNDPDVKELLEDNAFSHRFAPTHYYVSSGRDMRPRIRTALERCLNVQILTYSGAHDTLAAELDGLGSDVATVRRDMQANMTW